MDPLQENKPVLPAKLRLPPEQPSFVPRPRIVERLEQGRRNSRGLTLISAPAGFGKTMLMREWAVSTSAKSVWVSLDPGDDAPNALLRCLIAALPFFDGKESTAAISVGEQFRGWLQSLNRLEAETILFLDDYHAIRNFETHRMVEALLAGKPAELHVAIGTREDPPLPIARMRARGELTEIRAQELRFSESETDAFLRKAACLDLKEDDIRMLTARTEGWITGLQLAGLAMQALENGRTGSADAHEFVRAFSGDDRFIVDYLLAEVLDRLSEDVRDFLKRTSILDRLTAPLCDALTGGDDSGETLEFLEQRNLFLTPLDNRREWYRYHALFAQVLQLSIPAAERVSLHRKAAAWLRANGFEEDALRHDRAALEGRTALAPSEGAIVEPLSEREKEILRLLAGGLSNQDIADKLVIAPSTVKRHVSNIYGKLQVGSRTQAVAAGRVHGLLP